MKYGSCTYFAFLIVMRVNVLVPACLCWIAVDCNNVVASGCSIESESFIVFFFGPFAWVGSKCTVCPAGFLKKKKTK